MNENSHSEEINILFETTLQYDLRIEHDKTSYSGEAKIQLDEENFTLLPKLGETLFFPYRDIIDLAGSNYQVKLSLNTREVILLTQLGYQYEDFLRTLAKLRNEMILKDSLMQESVRRAGFRADFVYQATDNSQPEKGNCEPRLYETALVLIPEYSSPIRIPYSIISDVQSKDYSLIINTESGDQLTLLQMGSDFDLFQKEFSGAMTELAQKTQALIKELAPMVNSLVLRQTAKYMREGRAAQRAEIESVSPDLWKSLEWKISESNIKEEYEYLKSLSQQQKISIGVKRGLMGDMTGEYTWFLMPIYSTDSKKPGNAIVMEATSMEDSGKATYVFNILERTEYAKSLPQSELDSQVDQVIHSINHCMQVINFRREPIYLSDDKLLDPQYVRYYYAMERLPSLKLLRQKYIGRIIHSSFEQWKEDLINLLTFNVTSIDDSAKWKKGE